VIAKISSLPAGDALTLASKQDVADARTAYDALTAAQKELVTKYADLQAAEARIAVLQADKAAADAVIAKISGLPAVDALTLDSKQDVADARTAYDALTASQKDLVTNYADLQAAETRIAELGA
jgi:hypothetical protein